MKRRLTRVGFTIGIATALFAAFSSPASANTAIVGSQLANVYSGGISGAPVLSVQLSFDPGTSPNPVTSPANGVITGWRVKSADDGARYTLQVLRANGPVSLVTATNTNFTGIASVQAPSAVPAGTGATTPTGAIFSYPASLPIGQGDYIGVRVGGTGTNLPQFQANGLPRNLIANNFSGQPTDGQSANLLADEQHELLLQATIQFCSVPNVHKLKKKAAKALIAAADCGVKVKKKVTHKKKFRGKVLKQKKAPGTTAAPGTVVPIVIGKKD